MRKRSLLSEQPSYLYIVRKSVEEIQVSLKSEKLNGILHEDQNIHL